MLRRVSGVFARASVLVCVLLFFQNNITRLQKMFATNPAKGVIEPTGLLGVLRQPLSVQLLFSCSPQQGNKREGKKKRKRGEEDDEQEWDMREINK